MIDGVYIKLNSADNKTVVATFSVFILVKEAKTIVLAAIGATEISCTA